MHFCRLVVRDITVNSMQSSTFTKSTVHTRADRLIYFVELHRIKAPKTTVFMTVDESDWIDEALYGRSNINDCCLVDKLTLADLF